MGCRTTFFFRGALAQAKIFFPISFSPSSNRSCGFQQEYIVERPSWGGLGLACLFKQEYNIVERPPGERSGLAWLGLRPSRLGVAWFGAQLGFGLGFAALRAKV